MHGNSESSLDFFSALDELSVVWQREEVAAANSSPSGDRGLAPPAEGDDAEIEALLRALPTDLLSPKTPAKSSEPQATWPLTRVSSAGSVLSDARSSGHTGAGIVHRRQHAPPPPVVVGPTAPAPDAYLPDKLKSAASLPWTFSQSIGLEAVSSAPVSATSSPVRPPPPQPPHSPPQPPQPKPQPQPWMAMSPPRDASSLSPPRASGRALPPKTPPRRRWPPGAARLARAQSLDTTGVDSGAFGGAVGLLRSQSLAVHASVPAPAPGPPLPPRGGPLQRAVSLPVCQPVQQQQTELYKTELCHTFVTTGVCRYGRRCRFAHGAQELRPVRRHPLFKTQPCRTWAEFGTCPYGHRCRFRHGDDSPAALQAAPSPPHVQSLRRATSVPAHYCR